MKAGIIGIGYMGSIHAHNLNKLNVEIFLYDIDHEKAKRKAKELCANFIKDFHDFPKVDFFIVSTPAWTHSFYIFNLLSKNVPIFVEKPLVTSYSDFQKIIKAKNKDYIAVGHQLRFSAPYNYIKDLMKKR
jgi:predicted dehydrogenase